MQVKSETALQYNILVQYNWFWMEVSVYTTILSMLSNKVRKQ